MIGKQAGRAPPQDGRPGTRAGILKTQEWYGREALTSMPPGKSGVPLNGCPRCPSGQDHPCDNPRHGCKTCAGIGIVKQDQPDSYKACPDCQPTKIKSERV